MENSTPSDAGRSKLGLPTPDLLAGIAAFRRMRMEGRRLYDQFIARLRREMASLSPEPGAGADRSGKSGSGAPPRESGAMRRLGSLLGAIPRIPSFFAQKRRIRRAMESSGAGRNLVVCASSRRLHSERLDSGVRKYLSDLTRSFPGKLSEADLQEELVSASYLFVFDPEFRSPLWDRRAAYWSERVFVIDEAFVLFLAALSPFRAIRVCLGNLAAGRRSAPRNEIGFASLYALGCEKLLGRLEGLRALFLTSNSFSTEVTRWYLLRYPGCSWICEILHGIPTADIAGYFSSLLDGDGTREPSRKHFFIPQIPIALGSGVFSGRLLGGGEVAVNVYINKHAIDRAALHREWDALFSGAGMAPETLVVSFLGAATHERGFLNSDVFRVERLLMSRAKAALETSGRPHVLIYAPHPAQDLSQLRRHPFFTERGILVYPKTVFTWFFSDLAVALISSALFEAAYFNARPYSPMRAADGLFPQELLATLDLPEDDSRPFAEVFSVFLVRCAQELHADLRARSLRRLRLLSEAKSAELAV